MLKYERNQYDRKKEKKERKIRNILHRRIFVEEKKSQSFSREKGESTSSKKVFQRKVVAGASITTLYVSRNYHQYVSFNLVSTPQNFMADKTEKFRAQRSKMTRDR